MKKRITRAFTLAEVLITLGIIGVVAAMTMPSLIANHREKETITKLKKFVSVMSQAYVSVIDENGTANNWELKDTSADLSKDVYLKFKPYLSITKDCGYEYGCFPDVIYKELSGGNSLNFMSDVNKRYMVKLSDGSTVAFMGFSNAGAILGSYGGVYYDLNGDKAPNQFGKDLFQLSILNDRLVPTSSNNPDTEAIYQECIVKGYSCLSWIMANQNMDYLHCPDQLSWDGKTSCK